MAVAVLALRRPAVLAVAQIWMAEGVGVADGTISLHVYPNQNGRLYAGHFRAFDDPPATLRFARLAEGAEVEEGFTARDGTSWKLVSVDPK